MQVNPAEAGARSKTGFIDRDGNAAIPPTFDWALGFGDGLATVRIGSNWGFVDSAGTTVIEPQWNKSFNFSGELTLVGTDHKLI